MTTIPVSKIGDAANVRAWFDLVSDVARSKACQLTDEVQRMRDAGTVIYPPQADIFNAVATVHPTRLKCVVLGQDPYIHEGEAMGLAFSVRNDVVAPPSLANILNVLATDDVDASITGHDLTPWTRQGVMLLNTALTVKAGLSASHAQLGWDVFTRDVIRASLELPQPVVYLLWGRHAHTMLDMVASQTDPDLIVNKFAQRASHPSPLGCRSRGRDYTAFMESKPFSYANRMLAEHGSAPIDWSL